jgi:aspartyl-tRNA(Asn)/glutamyl-tRNA(Gln) amidotransferase subunit B
MDQGSMRCDVNVSVRHPGDELGTRAEIKNINSVRFIHQAIEYETRRQIEEIESGGAVALETRRYDPSDGVTHPMRSKEEAHDYRYFPDPDLLPLEFTQGFVDNIRNTLPELPDEKKERFERCYGVSASNAGVLVAERAKGDFFEALVASASDKSGKPESEVGQDCANILISDLFGILNKQGLSIDQSPIDHDTLAGLQALKLDGTISGRIAKDVFIEMLESGKQAADIVEEKGLRQVSDTGEINLIIDKIITDSPKQLAGYKAGKENLFGYFVGQVMKATDGKANPQIVNEILKNKL